MIKFVDYKNLGDYGALFSDQFKLRHREFIDRQDYRVSAWEGMEYDQFDTPAATYFIAPDDGKTAQGVSRLTPITRGCMLSQLWPHLVDDKSIFSSPYIWESTRFCIDHELGPRQRRQICYQLSHAHITFGLTNGIDRIIGLMPTLILHSVFEKSGVMLERLGPVWHMEGYGKVQAAAIPINEGQIDSIRAKMRDTVPSPERLVA